MAILTYDPYRRLILSTWCSLCNNSSAICNFDYNPSSSVVNDAHFEAVSVVFAAGSYIGDGQLAWQSRILGTTSFEGMCNGNLEGALVDDGNFEGTTFEGTCDGKLEQTELFDNIYDAICGIKL